MHADRIYVLEKGKVVETGTMASLRDEKGLYYAMWRQQIGERKNSQDISEPVIEQGRLNPDLSWKNYPLSSLAYNEEKNISRCIDSVKDVADEILILDSNSTDQTVAIAESRGAIVKQETFKGFIEKKNKAIQLASHDYILSLDADEALDLCSGRFHSKSQRKFYQPGIPDEPL